MMSTLPGKKSAIGYNLLHGAFAMGAVLSPLALVASISGILTMMSVDFSFVGFRLIPIFNSALCLNDIFTLSWSVSDIAITCLSNVVYMVILVVVLTKMFNSEKVMFKA